MNATAHILQIISIRYFGAYPCCTILTNQFDGIGMHTLGDAFAHNGLLPQLQGHQAGIDCIKWI